MLVFGAVQRVCANTITAFMEYVSRMDPQWQATFCLTLSKSEKQGVGFRSEAYKKWILDNHDLL
jgi:hypothetical protein